MAFIPKTLDVISAFSPAEQKHLYQKAIELKQAYTENNKEVLERFRINNPDLGVYEVFLEDSTRTKESFKNAIEFHRVKGHIFDTKSSSFNKKESYADTFNMLTGYHNQIFIVRSKLEGVCTWLKQSGKQYAQRQNLAFEPLFVNAWDGKHEHPTQEMLDQFTFLEQQQGNTSRIHIALIGDLLHGRTVHSKVDWLRIYDEVYIDLIAPDILQMPEEYMQKIQSYGYKVRVFVSLDAYIEQTSLANIWYFTRVQLERMGEDIIKQANTLRKAITCTKKHIDHLDESYAEQDIIFYHPLPRNKKTPVLPTFVDTTSYNGWETQSRNGYFMRIVILWALWWVPYIVDDFTGKDNKPKVYADDFVSKVALEQDKEQKTYAQWVNPIDNGITIDHIGKWLRIEDIKSHFSRINTILNLYTKWGDRISHSQDKAYKGIMFRIDQDLNEKQIRQLAAIAPWCTLNRIHNKKVIEKLRLSMPPRLYNFKDISCKNEECISHRKHEEHVTAEFIRQDQDSFLCIYCGKKHSYKDVWDM